MGVGSWESGSRDAVACGTAEGLKLLLNIVALGGQPILAGGLAPCLTGAVIGLL